MTDKKENEKLRKREEDGGRGAKIEPGRQPQETTLLLLSFSVCIVVIAAFLLATVPGIALTLLCLATRLLWHKRLSPQMAANLFTVMRCICKLCKLELLQVAVETETC